MDRLLTKCHTIVRHYKHSCQARKRLNALQKLNDEKCSKITQDVITRWNSEFIITCCKSLLCFTTYRRRLALGRELHCTATHTALSNKRSMPRYHTKSVNDTTNCFWIEVYEQEVYLEETRISWCYNCKKCSEGTEWSNIVSRNIFSTESNTFVMREAFHDAVQKTKRSIPNTYLEVNLAKLQVQDYLAEKTISRTQDPWKWQGENITRFPALKNVVWKYLPIPASERVFSQAGNIVTSKRTRLTEKHVKELVFLYKNFYIYVFTKEV
ncbi:hypothetical protein PR048_005344, partial [Dryococelus australis]